MEVLHRSFNLLCVYDMDDFSSHMLVAAPGLNNWTRRFRLGISAFQARMALNIVERQGQ